MRYELGYYGAKLLASFEFPKGVQTEPERDALGIPTIMGMIELPDGRKVTMDMVFTETEILRLYGRRRGVYVDSVNRALRTRVNQHQFDALVCMCFNVGIGAFEDEENNSVLRDTNKGNFENAAASFGKWVYGTLRGDRPGPDGGPARGPRQIYVGDEVVNMGEHLLEDDQVWKKAMGGLYRRHISEALLFCSLDWERAAHPRNIQLTKRTIEKPFGYYDVVRFKTPWKKIKDDAKYDTLPLDEEDSVMEDELFDLEPTQMERLQYESAKAAGSDDSLQEYVAHRRGLVMPVGQKELSVNTKAAEEVPYGINPDAGMVPKEETRRFQGAVEKEKGIEMESVGKRLAVTTGVVAGANTMAEEMFDLSANLGRVGLWLIAIGLLLGGLYMIRGHFRKRRGEKIELEGEIDAVQGMY